MLYRYCNINGFDILKNARLRLSRIDMFNDPFELKFAVDEDTALLNIKNEFKENSQSIEEWKTILSQNNILYDNTSEEDILEKFSIFQINDFRKALKEIWENWMQSMGIVCFSESMDVIQMWGHYTDNHRGIVIGIEENEFINDKEAIITVCYRDKIVLFPVLGHIDNLEKHVMKFIPEVLSRKETNWSYEKEVRIYGRLKEKENNGHYYIDIPSSSIKEIYLGLRSDSTTELIATCLKEREEYKHLKIYKMTKHPRAYKLIPEEITIG